MLYVFLHTFLENQEKSLSRQRNCTFFPENSTCKSNLLFMQYPLKNNIKEETKNIFF